MNGFPRLPLTMRDKRQFLLTWAHITGLWAIAVTHPLLEVLGRAPEFFVAHGARPADILLLVATLLVVPPAALTGAIAVAVLIGPSVARVVAGTVLAVLVSLLGLQIVKQLGVTSWGPAAASAMLAGILASLAYFQFAAVRSFTTVLSAAVAVVPLVFLLRPAIGRLVLPTVRDAVAADPRTTGFRPAPVVVLVFDELPLISLLDVNRQIDPVVYPNLSALAHDGIWFRNATTVADYTRWAMPPIVTGRRPRPGDLPTAGDHPDTLFSYLRRTHRLQIFEPVTRLCPRHLCDDPADTLRSRMNGMASDLKVVAAYVFLTPDLHERLRLPDLSANWGRFSAADALGVDANHRDWQRHADQRLRNDRRRVIRQFVDTIRPSDGQPGLHFLHALLPHQPWSLLPTGQRNATLAPLPSAMRVVARDDEWQIALNIQRHLLQVGYIDRAFGQVVARLKSTGLYDRAIVVVTADHGVAITRGQHVRQLGPETGAEIGRVPLIIKFPAGVDLAPLSTEVNSAGQRVSDRNVETIDIAPTVADALGVPLPWPTDGSSLLDVSKPPRVEKRIAFASGTRTQRYEADGPPMESLLRKRHEVFGAGNTYHIPRPPRFGELVGQPPSTYPIVDTSLTTDVGFSWEYQRFNPGADAVPFDVGGQLHGVAEDSPPLFVAVAVNATIQAVTRTLTTRPGVWLATPPLTAWRRGRNSIDVFVIQESEGQPVLGRVRRPLSRPEDLNLISGAAEQYWNVQQHGFFHHEGKGDRIHRWTRADASVVVALHGEEPVAIRLKVSRAVVKTMRFTLTANGCKVYEGTIPHADWEARLSLAGCQITGDELTIRLISDAKRPASGKDSRRLGLAVRHIILETTER